MNFSGIGGGGGGGGGTTGPPAIAGVGRLPHAAAGRRAGAAASTLEPERIASPRRPAADAPFQRLELARPARLASAALRLRPERVRR